MSLDIAHTRSAVAATVMVTDDVDGLMQDRMVSSSVMMVVPVMDRLTKPAELHEHEGPREPVYLFPYDQSARLAILFRRQRCPAAIAAALAPRDP